MSIYKNINIIKFPRKKLVFFSLFCLFFMFFLYCFIPIVFHSEKYIPERIFITDRNGAIITDTANEFGYKVKNSEIDTSSEFIVDLVQIEDKNFYHHWGVSIPSKIRAVKNNFFSGKRFSGGSTITEQYIKNHYFLGKKRSYLQKTREALLAFCFSLFYSKEEILEKYVSEVYFGNNIYGITGAADTYFGKKQEDLSPEERVLLLSLLRNPSPKNLYQDYFSDYFETVQTRLGYKFERKIFSLLPKENINRFPFVTQKIGKSSKASIDAELQQFSIETLRQTLRELQGKNVTNGAVFALDPKTMEVLIYIGSKDFSDRSIDGQVNIIESLRQPGSTFKPFLYLLALEKGAGTNSLLLDIENEYNSFQDGKTYISENYSLKEYGLVRFSKALGNSLNNASVRLAKELGLASVFSYYQKFGFTFLQKNPEHYGYSFVLGNPNISLESLLLAYTSLLPDFETKNRKPIFENQGEKTEEKMEKINEEKLLLYEILRNPDNRDISFGVHSILNTSIPQAVKTGTSSNFRDNLVVSYHPDFVIGVWVGNSDNSPMKGVTGITGAGYIWHQIVEKAIELGYIRNKKYEIPSGLESINYCLDTKCFRKEIELEKKGKKYFSNIAESIYDSRDIFESLSDYEKKKLEDLGFFVR